MSREVYCSQCNCYHEHGEHPARYLAVPSIICAHKGETGSSCFKCGSYLPGNGADAGNTKPSNSDNPKDLVGGRKLSFSLVPWTLLVGAAKALLEGAVKYGRFNWRMCGVRGSIYIDALKRHLAKFENGQDLDPKTKIHHLDSMIGCLAIMRDAMLYGKYTDDRPPCPDPDAMARLIDESEPFIAQLKETFKDENPYQFTIADTPSTRI